MVIYSRVPPPDWTDSEGGGEEGARCRKFPITKDPKTGKIEEDPWFREAAEALPICNGDWTGTPCPLRRSCLHISLQNNDGFGVWGGMTTPQRKWIRRNVKRHLWRDDDHLRKVTPPPDYFTDFGDEEDEDDDGETEET